ncbi:MAG: hypothetical protein KatS3mg126_0991 [Lysobacteraceae bacterium]|nr:MAG: hypothetical protein KatS3mg126_0991 [Xanthomonadaceae bacterium]
MRTAAVITTVALDHTEFLGRDREAIGREKAGILRRDRPLVLGELDPPDSVLQAAARGGARVLRRGRDFHAEDRPGGWRYRDREGAMELPPLPLAAPCQPANAATAIAALRALLPLDEASIRRGLAEVRIPGRMQRLPGPTEIVLDVAHNPQAAQMLARGLAARRPAGSTLAVFAALADKDAAALVGPLMGVVDAWHLAGLEGVGARAQPVEGLWPRIAGLLARVPCQRHATVVEALRAARADALPGDRIVVFGSFHTVAQALAELQAARD